MLLPVAVHVFPIARSFWGSGRWRGLMLAATLAIATTSFSQTNLYVSTSGSDSWSGLLAAPNSTKTDGPKATLYGARNAIRALKAAGSLSSAGAVVNVSPGTYYMPSYLDLSSLDSGTARAPITYVSTTLHGAVLEGGVQIKSWGALPSSLLSRVQSSVASKLVCVDLKALGVTDFGSIPSSSWCGNNPSDAIELYVNNVRQTLARWPNTGYASVGAPVPGYVKTEFTTNLSGSHTPATESNVYIAGFPSGFNWAWDQEPATFDPTSSTVYQSRSQAYANATGGRYFLRNSLEELDSVGEYYVDKGTGLLVWYPPKMKLRVIIAFASVNAYGPMIRMNGVSNVTFEGFAMQHGRSDAIVMKNCDNDTVIGNQIRFFGGSGIVLTEYPAGLSHDNLFRSNLMTDLGEHGIFIQAGDRLALTPANNIAENNVISHYGLIMPSYRAGVHVDGVGNQVLDNNVSYAPHTGIQVGGLYGANNNVVDGNHIWDVCMDTNDAGAIYICGTDASQRGNSFTDNLVEDVQARLPGSPAIWALDFDGHASGNYVAGNIFRNVNSGLMVAGGRDNQVTNNVFTNCVVNAIQLDDRCGDNFPNANYLYAVNYLSAPYATEYPLLATILDDYPAYPEGNLFTLNAFEYATPIFIRTGDGVHAVNSDVRDPYYVGWMNDVSGTGLFVNESAGDYTPVSGSALANYGFQALNANAMGALSDSYITVPTPDPTP